VNEKRKFSERQKKMRLSMSLQVWKMLMISSFGVATFDRFTESIFLMFFTFSSYLSLTVKTEKTFASCIWYLHQHGDLEFPTFIALLM
jgi:hypothetical protein